MKDNKIIAEFMGWDIKSPTTIPSNLHLSNLELDSGGVWVYKFHTSWDWLIPVVNKIEEECEGVPLQLLNCNLYSEIGEVYQAVVEFIKIYNESNKMDNLPPSVQQE